MPRKPADGVRAMTEAERQTRWRQRHHARLDALKAALERVAVARSVGEARAIAREALTPREAAA
jgi:hypothetical protein